MKSNYANGRLASRLDRLYGRSLRWCADQVLSWHLPRRRPRLCNIHQLSPLVNTFCTSRCRRGGRRSCRCNDKSCNFSSANSERRRQKLACMSANQLHRRVSPVLLLLLLFPWIDACVVLLVHEPHARVSSSLCVSSLHFTLISRLIARHFVFLFISSSLGTQCISCGSLIPVFLPFFPFLLFPFTSPLPFSAACSHIAQWWCGTGGTGPLAVRCHILFNTDTLRRRSVCSQPASAPVRRRWCRRLWRWWWRRLWW